jgi:hypothetical protein
LRSANVFLWIRIRHSSLCFASRFVRSAVGDGRYAPTMRLMRTTRVSWHEPPPAQRVGRTRVLAVRMEILAGDSETKRRLDEEQCGACEAWWRRTHTRARIGGVPGVAANTHRSARTDEHALSGVAADLVRERAQRGDRGARVLAASLALVVRPLPVRAVMVTRGGMVGTPARRVSGCDLRPRALRELDPVRGRAAWSQKLWGLRRR